MAVLRNEGGGESIVRAVVVARGGQMTNPTLREKRVNADSSVSNHAWTILLVAGAIFLVSEFGWLLMVLFCPASDDCCFYPVYVH